MSRLKTKTTAAALAISVVGGFEGIRQYAYPDPGTHGRPWTICMGATEVDGRPVQPGDHLTVPECRALLVKQLDLYADRVEACTTAPMPDTRFVAFVSFAFNLGPARYCSSIAPLVNAGKTREGCDALLKYNRAAGIVLPGLTARRQRERAFCLEGL